MNAEIRKLTISTLSPVHIGCGEDFEPGNFVIHEGLLHALDVETLAAELSEADQKNLLKASEERDPIGAIQRFFKSRSAKFAETSTHTVRVAPAIAKEYEEKMGRCVQQDSNAFNQFHLARTCWLPINNAAYLPGTSLKGSIRTAWLNALIRKNNPLQEREKRDIANTKFDTQKRAIDNRNVKDIERACRNLARPLQERLLEYRNFEDDPFRLLAISDAIPEADTAPPLTNILYAVSKKRSTNTDSGQKGPPMRLETLLEAMNEAFFGEIRFLARLNPSAKDVVWKKLCDACNEFYMPQLLAELDHPLLNAKLDPTWRQLIRGLLCEDLEELKNAHQGFLLRVGRHSGAESVTLDGIRSIKILGGGGQPITYRGSTTQKRFAASSAGADQGLLPFGWIWVNACDDEHRHLHDALCRKLAERSRPLLEEEQDRRQKAEGKRLMRQHEIAEAIAKTQAEAAAEAEKAAQLAAMTPAMREIAEFCEAFRLKAEALRGGKERLNADFHSKARAFAQKALEAADWSAEDKKAAADAIAEWLPKVVEKIDKDQLKKLKLSALRGLV